MRHAAGAIMYDGGSASGWTVIQETIQCVHCGAHINIVPGSGRERGFCLNCMGVVCGHKNCYECIPEEQMLLNMEAAGDARWKASQDEAENAAEQLGIKNELVVDDLANRLLTLKAQGVDYKARMDANIRAIRG